MNNILLASFKVLSTCSAKLERVMGIEPTSSAWEAEVLPLNYTRNFSWPYHIGSTLPHQTCYWLSHGDASETNFRLQLVEQLHTESCKAPPTCRTPPPGASLYVIWSGP